MDEKKEKLLRATIGVLVPAFFIGSLAFHASESYRMSNEDIPLIISDDNKDLSNDSKPEKSVSDFPETEKNFSIDALTEDSAKVPFIQAEELSENNYVVEKKLSEDKTIIEESSESSIDETYNTEISPNSEASENLYTEASCDSEDSADICADAGITYADYDAIPYDEEDLFKFEATMTVECGAQGTSREVIIADAWIMRNHIQEEIENGSEDPFRSALNPDHFQPVFDDEYGWRVMHYDEPVTQSLIDENSDIHEIAVAVLNGEIPSPIGDWGCCLPYDYFGFEDGYSFAQAAGIEHYIIIENGVFFPASDWTDMCTWFCQNY